MADGPDTQKNLWETLKHGWQNAVTAAPYLAKAVPPILIKWGAFSILLPLVPIILKYYETDGSSDLLKFFLREEEISIISVVLCGEGLGEVLTASEKIPAVVKLLTGAGAFILSVFACFLYKDIGHASDPDRLAGIVRVIFIGALIISASSQVIKVIERN